MSVPASVPSDRAESPTADEPLLQVSKLRYGYGRDLILDDVSFQLDAGELVVLAGRNGAGKSTLLRCIAGWTRASAGTITVAGLPLQESEREARRQLILVPDMPVFYDALTAWEHLQFVARANRLPDWEPQAEELMRHFGLWEDRDDIPDTYSRGMRYKMALCLALLVEPPMLLLDEPLGPLDALSADQLWHDLLVYRDAGMAVLLSSHQLPSDVQPDRYMLIEQGRLLVAGTPAELQRRLGVSAHPTLEALLRAAVVEETNRRGR